MNPRDTAIPAMKPLPAALAFTAKSAGCGSGFVAPETKSVSRMINRRSQ